jgi:hypothetical protein
MTKTLVTLKPVPGFCIKSSTLQPGFYTPTSTAVRPRPDVLEPQSSPIPVPIGLKVFINIAWDVHVPPPPAGSEEAIQLAMKGEDIDELNPDGWYVPVIVSEGRQDKDKGTLFPSYCSPVEIPPRFPNQLSVELLRSSSRF